MSELDEALEEILAPRCDIAERDDDGELGDRCHYAAEWAATCQACGRVELVCDPHALEFRGRAGMVKCACGYEFLTFYVDLVAL